MSEALVGRLVGRDVDIRLATDRLRRAEEGRGRLILVSGEAGIGKTRLAEEIAGLASARRFDVLWGRCSVDEGAPGFWPWTVIGRALLESRSDEDLVSDPGWEDFTELLRERNPSSSPVDRAPSGPERFQMFDGITRFLHAVAARRPLCMILDDIHWADEASLQLLRFIGETVVRSKIVIVATFRDEGPNGSTLRSSIAELPADIDRIDLAGLDEAAIGEVVEETVGAPITPELSVKLHERTLGNPFFARELARLLAAQQHLSDASPDKYVEIPRGVRDVLQSRLARLTQPCSDLLEFAAAIGMTFDLHLLQRAADRGLENCVEALDEATEAHIISSDQVQHRFRFVHALMWETAYSAIPESKRRRIHLRIADELERNPDERRASISQIAHHLYNSYPEGSEERVVAALREAGESALASSAYEEAARHLQLARDLVPSQDGIRRAEISFALAEAISRFGARSSSNDHYELALHEARSAGDSELFARSALGRAGGHRGFEVEGLDEQVVAWLEAALDEIGDGDGSLRSWLNARLSVALTFFGEEERRKELALRAIDLADAAGDPAAHAYALSAYCDIISGPDHIAERSSMAERMIALAKDAADPELELLARRFRVEALAEGAELTAFDAEVEIYARLADRLRQPVYSWYVHVWRGMRADMDGRFEECDAHLAEAERVGIDEARSENALLLINSLRFSSGIRRQQPVRSNARLDLLIQKYSGAAGPQLMLAVFDMDAGRTSSAGARLERAWDMLRKAPKDGTWLAVVTAAADVCVRVDQREIAPAIYRTLLPYAGQIAMDGVAGGFLGAVDHWLGVLAALEGRSEDAVDHLQNAIRIHASVGAPVFLALSQREQALVLAGSSDKVVADRARAQLSAADEALATLGIGAAPTPVPLPLKDARFTREGDGWAVRFGGREARFKDTKGMGDLARLLSTPGREWHVLDLSNSNVVQTDLPDDALDERARRELKARLAELQADVDEAAAAGDTERASKLELELDFIATELGSSYGLGGRPRSKGGSAEKARKAVTWRIREAIGRIEKAHPGLGRHLSNSIRTGTFCSYEPESPVDWQIGSQR